MNTPLLAGPRFELDPAFVASYAERPHEFGFNGLGELTYLRSYARTKPDGSQERWFETCARVVSGTYTMQKRWILANRLPWSERKAQRSAQEMYDRMYRMLWLPPGRGLWAMGSPLTDERGLFAALFNCMFISTTLVEDPRDPFTVAMDASMCGVGVGFDTLGAGQWSLVKPTGKARLVIPDSRDGWVDSLRCLLGGFFGVLGASRGGPLYSFDYSQIRASGEPIKGFGGVSGGPEPLKELHAVLTSLLGQRTGQPIDSTTVVDILNLVGKCVVSGNARRTALLALGSPEDQAFLNLKNYQQNPDRAAWGWSSNNSVSATLGMDYHQMAERIRDNGEPGFLWLENVQRYGRLGELKPDAATGCNPCAEISLENYELCNLCDVLPARHASREDFLRTLKFAYLYCKTVTLSTMPWPESNRVMLRNRRIGVSQTGIQQAVAKLGLHEYQRWCVDGYDTLQRYDQVYSDWLAIPRSVRLTTVKPNGSTALLSAATPGIHWPEARTYIRRVRLAQDSPLVASLRRAGYPVEPDAANPRATVVVEFPVRLPDELRTAGEVSLWEQLAMGAFMQRYWADNMVSQTVTFDPATEGPMIALALQYASYQLKSVSFLPRVAEGAYAQMPYEAIDEAEYQRRVQALGTLELGGNTVETQPERFCSNDTCTL